MNALRGFNKTDLNFTDASSSARVTSSGVKPRNLQLTGECPDKLVDEFSLASFDYKSSESELTALAGLIIPEFDKVGAAQRFGRVEGIPYNGLKSKAGDFTDRLNNALANVDVQAFIELCSEDGINFDNFLEFEPSRCQGDLQTCKNELGTAVSNLGKAVEGYAVETKELAEFTREWMSLEEIEYAAELLTAAPTPLKTMAPVTSGDGANTESPSLSPSLSPTALGFPDTEGNSPEGGSSGLLAGSLVGTFFIVGTAIAAYCVCQRKKKPANSTEGKEEGGKKGIKGTCFDTIRKLGGNDGSKKTDAEKLETKETEESAKSELPKDTESEPENTKAGGEKLKNGVAQQLEEGKGEDRNKSFKERIKNKAEKIGNNISERSRGLMSRLSKKSNDTEESPKTNKPETSDEENEVKDRKSLRKKGMDFIKEKRGKANKYVAVLSDKITKSSIKDAIKKLEEQVANNEKELEAQKSLQKAQLSKIAELEASKKVLENNLKEQTKEANKALENKAGEREKAKEALENTKNKLEETNKALENLEKDLKRAKAAIKYQARELEKTKKALGNTEKKLKNSEVNLQKSETQVSQLEKDKEDLQRRVEVHEKELADADSSNQGRFYLPWSRSSTVKLS